MFIKARVIGLGREEFWDLTLRELIREFVVSKRLNLNRYDDEMTIAWTTAALMRQEKLPKLDKLLARHQTLQQQPRKEQLMVIQSLSAQLGIPLRRVRLINRDIHGR